MLLICRLLLSKDSFLKVVFLLKNLLFLVLLCFSVTCHAIDIPVLDPDKELSDKYIGRYILTYEDPGDSLDIDDVLLLNKQGKFILSQKVVPNYLVSPSAFWFKIKVDKEKITQHNQYYFNIPYADIDKIHFYAVKDDSVIKELKVGNHYPYNNREIAHHFSTFSLVPDCDVYYLRFRSNSPMAIPIQLLNQKELFAGRHAYDVWQGIYFGLVILIIVVNLILYFIVRDKLYLSYAFHVLGTVLTLIGIQCSLSGLIYPDSIFFNTYSIAFFAVAAIPTGVFIMIFLKTKLHTPLLHGIYIILMCSLAIAAVLNIAGYNFLAHLILEGTGLSTILYVFILAYYICHLGYTPARYFLVAWAFYFGGVLVLVLLSLDIIPYSIIVYNSFQIGAGIEILIVSFAIPERIKLFKKEKENWHEMTLNALKENENLVKEQNALLEDKVKKRTSVIEKHREEIINRNKEIEAKNLLLNEANEIIQCQNSILKDYSQTLERQVQERTMELSKSYKELISKNTQLEQFTYVSAHNLRAPVATLLGLTYIFNKPEADPDNALIIEKIKETCQKLDDIIIDLNTILDISKDIGTLYETVNISELLNKVKELLKIEIEDNNVTIECDHLACETVFTVKPYLESILYNLISNAIKYKSLEEAPVVQIKMERKNEEIILTVKDNGIGIDLKKYGEKLFGLYKRFSFHVKGKGLGLFIVKTQVELLEGRIEVQSNLKQGTEFKIYLPVALAYETAREKQSASIAEE